MPVQGDILRFDTIGDFDDIDQIVGVYHVEYLSVTSIAAEQAIGDWKAIFGDLWEILQHLHSILVTIRRVRGYNVTTSQLMGESAFGTPKVGANTGDSGATQITVPLTFKTLFPRVMLRKLWGPPGESLIDTDGRFVSGVDASLAAAAVFLMDTLEGGGREYKFGYPSPVALTFAVPTVAVYSNIPGTLRRRRIGVGS